MKELSSERFIYCKTCGKVDKAWFLKPCNKRKMKNPKWKKLIINNHIYFGYKLLKCVEEGHDIKPALTFNQIMSKMKRKGKHGSTSTTTSNFLHVCRSLALS